MRRIVKTHAPQDLVRWREDNKDVNHSYDDLRGTKAHQVLKDKLLTEQGGICAYTGRAIESSSSHVEHLKPQNQCADWEDVEYKNVVACFPANGGDVSHGYGAPVKADWWDKKLFVSPLAEDCERRFRFNWSGSVEPNPCNHRGAKETIKVLCLDNEALRKLRKSRINGFFGCGSRTSSKPLSIPEANIALANIDQLDGNGRITEFCFVLKQLLPEYIAEGKVV